MKHLTIIMRDGLISEVLTSYPVLEGIEVTILDFCPEGNGGVYVKDRDETYKHCFVDTLTTEHAPAMVEDVGKLLEEPQELFTLTTIDEDYEPLSGVIDIAQACQLLFEPYDHIRWEVQHNGFCEGNGYRVEPLKEEK